MTFYISRLESDLRGKISMLSASGDLISDLTLNLEAL